ncbi:MAG: nucleotidyltransferase domain-containing protein [Candidatus Korarchaeum sp.]|jgi:predicted nucleotidyltransferase|nr:nucleotidyltransferase domain-containing protein [Candidatus Korarchaeum sp.]
MEVLNRRIEFRRSVIEGVRKWAEGLPFKATVILIGSYARGDFNLWSDVDIILIAEFPERSPVERLMRIDHPPGYEVIPLTPEEFADMFGRKEPMVMEALRSGIPIKDDMGILKRYLRS